MNKINVTCMLYVLAALILADLQKIVIAKSFLFHGFQNFTFIDSKKPTYFSMRNCIYFLPKTFCHINFKVFDT